MVGPTPVSALIHAATMVTAGVYMIARLHFLYLLSPDAMEVVAVIGAVTCIFAATIAIVQPDIKRVLAYSTISQLGYMFLAVGVGAFPAGIFHLMTHAFFKALLFLCAGSVIHGMSGEQDMNKMGALKAQDAYYLRHDVDRDAGDRGDSAVFGLLLQGPDSGRRLYLGAFRAVADRPDHRGAYRALHVPADVHDLPWRVTRRSRAACTICMNRRPR